MNNDPHRRSDSNETYVRPPYPTNSPIPSTLPQESLEDRRLRTLGYRRSQTAVSQNLQQFRREAETYADRPRSPYNDPPTPPRSRPAPPHNMNHHDESAHTSQPLYQYNPQDYRDQSESSANFTPPPSPEKSPNRHHQGSYAKDRLTDNDSREKDDIIRTQVEPGRKAPLTIVTYRNGPSDGEVRYFDSERSQLDRYGNARVHETKNILQGLYEEDLPDDDDDEDQTRREHQQATPIDAASMTNQIPSSNVKGFRRRSGHEYNGATNSQSSPSRVARTRQPDVRDSDQTSDHKNQPDSFDRDPGHGQRDQAHRDTEYNTRVGSTARYTEKACTDKLERPRKSMYRHTRSPERDRSPARSVSSNITRNTHRAGHSYPASRAQEEEEYNDHTRRPASPRRRDRKHEYKPDPPRERTYRDESKLSKYRDSSPSRRSQNERDEYRNDRPRSLSPLSSDGDSGNDTPRRRSDSRDRTETHRSVRSRKSKSGRVTVLFFIESGSESESSHSSGDSDSWRSSDSPPPRKTMTRDAVRRKKRASRVAAQSAKRRSDVLSKLRDFARDLKDEDSGASESRSSRIHDISGLI